jgi:gamma-glutamyltranspeptidase / glutathione hydrolase
MSDRIVRTFSAVPRPAVQAGKAMVATSQPLAVQAGMEVLRAGGTAVDAAIAANGMLSLVEPMSCGPGGDLFAIVWDEATQRLVGLNGSGRSPSALSRADILGQGHTRIPPHGPLSWSVPGCVDAWFALHGRFGRTPMGDLLMPAIRAAHDGFSVTPVIARMWASAAERLAQDPGASAVFLPKGRAPEPGELFRNPRLAHTLTVVADGGRDAFYRGPFTEQLVAFSARSGGYFSFRDFESHSSTWVDPVSVVHRGHRVWQLPPNTQGLALLQMLKILDPFDLGNMGHNSADYLHLIIEAKKLAYEDRARFYADPDFFEVPVDALLSDERAEALRTRLDLHKAACELPWEDPRTGHGDTVYLTAVDEEGNAVSLIQSIYEEFGSGIVPPELGFALQNRGCLFDLDPNRANAYAPNKRPFHTIMPGFVTQGGQPVFSFGVMGGDMQPQGQLQVLVNRIDFAMDPQWAGEALRVRHLGSSTPVGDRMTDGGLVRLEQGFSGTVAKALAAKGHRVETASDGFGGYQGIWIDRRAGRLLGGSDPRKDGCALGY